MMESIINDATCIEGADRYIHEDVFAYITMDRAEASRLFGLIPIMKAKQIRRAEVKNNSDSYVAFDDNDIERFRSDVEIEDTMWVVSSEGAQLRVEINGGAIESGVINDMTLRRIATGDI